MRRTSPLVALGLLLALGACERQHAEDVADLPTLMLFMERYAEKLYLAGSAGNWPLAAIYVHELEEVGEDLRDGGFEKNGVELGEMARELFLPAVARVDASLDIGRERFDEAYADLVQACNSCHAATGYGAVRIVAPVEARPYPGQQFIP